MFRRTSWACIGSNIKIFPLNATHVICSSFVAGKLSAPRNKIPISAPGRQKPFFVHRSISCVFSPSSWIQSCPQIDLQMKAYIVLWSTSTGYPRTVVLILPSLLNLVHPYRGVPIIRVYCLRLGRSRSVVIGPKLGRPCRIQKYLYGTGTKFRYNWNLKYQGVP